MLRNKTYILILALLLLAVGQFLDYSGFFSYNTTDVAQKTERYILSQEKKIHSILEDSANLRLLVAGKPGDNAYPELADGAFSILVYQKDSLVYWNNNLVAPYFPLSKYEEGSNYVKLRNGWYDLIKFTSASLQSIPEESTLIFLVPVKYEYTINNQYLRDHLSFPIDHAEFIHIGKIKNDESLPVHSFDGNPLFYVELQDYGDEPNEWLWLIYWAFLLVLVVYINTTVNDLAKRSHFFAGLGLLIIFLLLIRLLMIDLDYPLKLKFLELFQPKYYASDFAESLGEMLLHILFLFWVSVYFFRNANPKKAKPLKALPATALASGIILLVLLCGDGMMQVIESLIIDSRISFTASDLLNFDGYSAVGFTAVSLLLVSMLLFTIRIIELLKVWIPGPYITYTGFATALLIHQSIYYLIPSEFPLWIVAGVSVLILILYHVKLTGGHVGSFTTFVFLLICMAAFAAYGIQRINLEKEYEQKKLLSSKLSFDKEPITEYLFRDKSFHIRRDYFIQSYFRNPLLAQNALTNRIQYLYFSGYYKKFDFKAMAYNVNGLPLKGAGETSLEQFQQLAANEAEEVSRYLYFVPNSVYPFSYFTILPIYDGAKKLGDLLIQFVPKIYSQQNVYPELLLEEKIRPPRELEKYSYAIYKNNRLTNKNGDFPYHDRFVFEPSLEFQQIYEDGYMHLYYNTGRGKGVIISDEHNMPLDVISLFSIIFCLLTVLLFIVIPLDFSIRYLLGMKSASNVSVSFGDRIHFTVVFVLVFSFIMIGSVTFVYFNLQYEEYHRERLLRKGRSIQASVEYFMEHSLPSKRLKHELSDFQKDLALYLAENSDIHSLDINLFSASGDLIASSQPEIFEKGLVMKKMHPVPLHHLAKDNLRRFVQNEQIGDLNYLAVYKPIKDETGVTVAYLNIPYFTREKGLKQEISPFLVALINVYVVLLLVAGFLALFISRSITRSLTEVSAKFKQIELGKKNQMIEWRSNDEIGALVAEYNKMIGELEKSAQLLAKSERESAWREMAKQVAHEIKNPLTPMKLSIQHLQRAMRENHPNVKEMTEKVTHTIIEQIDTLSNIATEFSSFAQMPRTSNEQFNLTELMYSVIDLYKGNPSVKVITAFSEQKFEVYADKDQMLRVFNNLISNAIQAIPDDRNGIIKADVKGEKGFVVVSVEDNGVGIKPNESNKVFAPNFTTKSSGTGLGLAMSKNIVEFAGGNIWFDSEPEVGTTFYVKLPRAKSKETHEAG